jgi:CubicO group peptidase (beta-lactamase class C family)
MRRIGASELLANAVTPLVRIGGFEERPQGILGRMQAHGVPGVQVALIEDDEVTWSAGYGELEKDSGRPVEARSLFQAASISKPVTALAVLRLIADGVLDLDRPVNAWLRSWKLPENEHTLRQPVTLRALLSHTAGTTVHGFPGYPSDAPRPTLLQILDGEPPANTDPVRVDIPVGTQFRYSGGGTMIVQQVLIDATGETFPELMTRLVLEPLRMSDSTYEQPLPLALHARAATAHDDAGPVPGKWHVYPEMAAAGLWTTASDLARFVLGIERAIAGQPGALIPVRLAREMVRAQNGVPVGLGPQLAGSDHDPRFFHSGGNRGFNCRCVGFVEHADGVVVMTNGPFSGARLLNEVIGAIGASRDWLDFVVPQELKVRTDSEGLDAFVGAYEVGGMAIGVRLDEDGLCLDGPFGPQLMHRTGDREFVLADTTRVSFEVVDGAITATLAQWGNRYVLTHKASPGASV